MQPRVSNDDDAGIVSQLAPPTAEVPSGTTPGASTTKEKGYQREEHERHGTDLGLNLLGNSERRAKEEMSREPKNQENHGLDGQGLLDLPHVEASRGDAFRTVLRAVPAKEKADNAATDQRLCLRCQLVIQ